MDKCATSTVGVDVGDKSSVICVIDVEGDKVEEAKIPTTIKGIERYFAKREACLVALEVGTHSPWMSEQIGSYGHTVIVANARRLPLIYSSNDKDDRNDAELLARVARMDPKLLKPVTHRSEDRQAVLALIHARDALVRGRTQLINHCRGTVKATGGRLKASGAASFYRLAKDLPEERRAALDPVMKTLEVMSDQIKLMEAKIQRECAEQFPETKALQQVAGVGPITSLAFVTALESPERFKKNRDVAGYLGLRPKRAQSSSSDPQLRITKSGNPYLRRLLVGSAHYVLGPFGPDTDLRTWGLKLAQRGGKNAKKRAVVAVARKLAILLLVLWRSQDTYLPQRNSDPNGDLAIPSDSPQDRAALSGKKAVN